MLKFVKYSVSTSLLINCSNLPMKPYRMSGAVLQLKFVFPSSAKDATIVCGAHDPEFSWRECHLNSRTAIVAEASENCEDYETVLVTCSDKGTFS